MPPVPRLHTVLVVDDEPLQRLILTHVLQAAGFQPQAVGTLAEARAALADQRPDALVLDLSLRDEDSLGLLRHLADIGQAPAIVFVSGMDTRIRAATSRLAQTLGLNVAGTLCKPVQAAALHALLAAPAAAAPRHRGVQPLAPAAEELAAAMDEGGVIVHYQPKFRLSDGALVGAEALARWPLPDGAMVPPDVFVPLAERTGLIHRLTRLVLGTALATCARMRQAVAGFTMAVNISPLDLRDPGLPDLIDHALRQNGLPPAALVAELTEGCVIDDPVQAAETLTRLRIRGIGLSIDDFGTGHSSLLSLLRLPFSELKIDKSFTQDFPADAEAAKITRAVVALARELGLRTVAEGVETQACADQLREMGCDVVQGWLFGKAMGADELLQGAIAPARQAVA